MNNNNISISQVAAALDTKIKNKIESLKKENEDLRLKCYSYQNSFRSLVLAEIEMANPAAAIVKGMVALFPTLRGDISIRYSVMENSYCLIPSVPSCFTDFESGKLDFSSKTYRVITDGIVEIKPNGYGDKYSSFNFHPRFLLKKSKELVTLITNWHGAVITWMDNNNSFKKINKIQDNFNNECQLIHMQLTNPEAHKTLVEFVDNYVNSI